VLPHQSTVKRTLDLSVPLEHFTNNPTLVAGNRPSLFDPDNVPRVALIVCVVRHELARLADSLVVQAVPPNEIDCDNDRLIHLVADDPTDFLGSWRLAGLFDRFG
jgi:hypothetical protein